MGAGACCPRYAARRRAALLLSPANLAPLAFGRNVVVIHDAAALREPGWYSRLYVTWQRAVLPALARRALHLVTVSQFSRDELVDLLGADPAKITVIPGGVDERFRPGIEPARRERPYVITVASRTARKNLAALEETARGSRATASTSSRSAATGRSSPARRAASGSTWLGHVDDEELPGAVRGRARRSCCRRTTRASG